VVSSAQEQLQRETRPSRNRACLLVALENGPAPSAQERLQLGYTKADEAARMNQAQVPGKWARRVEMPPENEEANGQTVS